MRSPYVLLAGSCDVGPCPTLYVHDSGDVLVQGYVTDAALPSAPSSGTGVLSVPAAAWRTLLSRLPYGLITKVWDVWPSTGFYVHERSGDVLVLGYVTGDLPPDPLPAGEGVLHMPAAAWREQHARAGR